MKIKKTVGERLFDVLNVTLCSALFVIFLYPFWDTLLLSMSNAANASKLTLRILPDFPLAFESYQKVFEQPMFLIAIRNTLARTVIGTVLTVLFTFCGAYVLAKKTLPFRNGITFYILFTMFFSGGLIPGYLLMQNLGLLNNFWVLILPQLTSAWYLIIARNFIIGIPDSLDEAAMLDGAGVLRTMFSVIFPVSKPIIAVVALWSAIGHWNAWYDAYIYNRDRNLIVLQQLLRSILIDDSADMMGKALVESAAATTPETVKAATIIVATVPIACVYPFFQKYFMKGIQVGAVKG